MKELILKYKDRCFPLLDQAIVSGGNFVMGILLARTLGLESYGEYALAWLVVLFCSSVHHAWIVSPMYTFYPQKTQEDQSTYFSALLVHQSCFSILAAFVAWTVLSLGGNRLLGWEIEGYIPLILWCIVSYLTYDFIRRALYAKQNASRVLILDSIVYGTQLLGVLLISQSSSWGLQEIFSLLGIAYSLSILFALPWVKQFNWNRKAFVELAKTHWDFSKWLLATSLLQWMSGNFFIIAAGSILSPVAVGTIRIMQNIIGLLHVLFLAIENYVPLKASHLFKTGGLEQLGHFLRQITWKGGALTLLLAIGIASFGEEIISLLYEGKYAERVDLLYGFAALYLLVFIGTNYRFAIRTLEKTRAIFIAYVWSASFSLFTAHIVIQSFGVAGVVVGLIVTQLIMQLYFMYSLRTKLNLFWK